MDGTPSELKSNCPHIGEDIQYCQSLGKKILLSLGGAVPTNQNLESKETANEFADTLWRLFGPNKELPGSTYPRPFQNAAVDGFDLDIESILVDGQDEDDLDRGYGTLVNRLRHHYDKEPKRYYISGAPQCVVPDAHLAKAIEQADFDFLFVQFYNTNFCSARAFFDHTYGSFDGERTDISFDAWVQFVHNSHSQAKVYLGLPAAPSIPTQAAMYLQPSEAKEVIAHFQCKYPEEFGGVMVYEATASGRNSVEGMSYADKLKGYLTHNKDCANKALCPVPSIQPPVMLSTGTGQPIQTGASSYPISGTGKYPVSGATGSSSGFSFPSGGPIKPSGSVRTYPLSTGGSTSEGGSTNVPINPSGSVGTHPQSTGGTQPHPGSTGLPVRPSGSVRSYSLSTGGTTSKGGSTGLPVSPSGSVRTYPLSTGGTQPHPESTGPPVTPSGSVRSYSLSAGESQPHVGSTISPMKPSGSAVSTTPSLHEPAPISSIVMTEGLIIPRHSSYHL